MRVAYVGNFRPQHSTENDVRAGFEAEGHEVIAVQEDDIDWRWAPAHAGRVDFVLWTHTHALAPEGTHDDQRFFLDGLRERGVPVVAFHLDRWWGLEREHQVHDEPYFRASLVCTADGGHDDEWAAAGVNHVWLPPAVNHVAAEAGVGRFTRRFGRPVVWVGSWQLYHPEWRWRYELVLALRRRYRDRIGVWPRAGQAVRGQDLLDLYASCKVVVGDSCLAGGATHYWSDRIPETVGRGGFLIHPEVPGLDLHFTPGEHLWTVPLGDLDAMREAIDYWIDPGNDVERGAIAAAGRAHVVDHHTYRVRARQLTELVRAGAADWR